MDLIIETFKNTGSLHHAYLIEGDQNTALDKLAEFLEHEVGVPWKGNPDFRYSSFETMGIEDARALSEMQQQRAFGGTRKIFIVSADTLTVEAQNSLLKVLEEPTEGTHFFFLMRTSERLLPTLASRLVVIRLDKTEQQTWLKETEAFLSAGPAKRAEILKSMIDNKDKAEAVQFITALLRTLRVRTDLVHAGQEEIFALSEIEKGRQYLLDRSPSAKLILEHIAAVIPQK